jgi:hypothetical protein
MAGLIELLDDRKLVAQFVNLERRTARQGRDSVDQAVGSHDDLCNGAAGALMFTAAQAAGGYGLCRKYHALLPSCSRSFCSTIPLLNGFVESSYTDCK